MRLDWGQGKFEVEKHRQEILDLLADGWTLWRIFQHLRNAHSLLVSERTFYRTVKKMRAPALACLPSRAAPAQLSPSSPLALPPPAASPAAGRMVVASAAESLPSEPSPAPLAVPRAQSSLEESSSYIKKSFSDEELL